MEAKQKTFTFGGGKFSKMSPREVTNETKAVNFTMTFEEALKLRVAVEECIRHLNAMNRATKEGKESAFNIVFYFDTGQFAVTRRAKVKTAVRAKAGKMKLGKMKAVKTEMIAGV